MSSIDQNEIILSHHPTKICFNDENCQLHVNEIYNIKKKKFRIFRMIRLLFLNYNRLNN